MALRSRSCRAVSQQQRLFLVEARVSDLSFQTSETLEPLEKGGSTRRVAEGWATTAGVVDDAGNVIPTRDRQSEFMSAARRPDGIDFKNLIPYGYICDSHRAVPARGAGCTCSASPTACAVHGGKQWAVLVGIPESLEFADVGSPLSEQHGKVGWYMRFRLIDRADPSSWLNSDGSPRMRMLQDGTVTDIPFDPTRHEFDRADDLWKLGRELQNDGDAARTLGLSIQGRKLSIPTQTGDRDIVYATAPMVALIEHPHNPDATVEEMREELPTQPEVTVMETAEVSTPHEITEPLEKGSLEEKMEGQNTEVVQTAPVASPDSLALITAIEQGRQADRGFFMSLLDMLKGKPAPVPTAENPDPDKDGDRDYPPGTSADTDADRGNPMLHKGYACKGCGWAQAMHKGHPSYGMKKGKNIDCPHCGESAAPVMLKGDEEMEDDMDEMSKGFSHPDIDASIQKLVAGSDAMLKTAESTPILAEGLADLLQRSDRLEQMNKGLDPVLAAIADRLEQLNTRLDGFDQKLETRFEALEKGMRPLTPSRPATHDVSPLDIARASAQHRAPEVMQKGSNTAPLTREEVDAGVEKGIIGVMDRISWLAGMPMQKFTTAGAFRAALNG